MPWLWRQRVMIEDKPGTTMPFKRREMMITAGAIYAYACYDIGIARNVYEVHRLVSSIVHPSKVVMETTRTTRNTLSWARYRTNKYGGSNAYIHRIQIGRELFRGGTLSE